MREYFEDDSQRTFADVVNGPVAKALEGETVDTAQDAHTYLRETELPTRLKTEAISTIDVAIHDIQGQELGAPVYELLAEEYGTNPTTNLPLYASAGMYMEPEEYLEQAKIIEALGFVGYKYRPGIGPSRDRETITLLADALCEAEFMLDAHTWWKLRDSYSFDTVRDLVNHAEDQGAFWIEEPVAPDNYDGYYDLAENGPPLAGGESEPDPAGLIRLGKTGAVDFLQGDVRHHEGFTGCRQAVEFCSGNEVEFVPHNFGTWLGLTANAHLVAAAPEVNLLEYPVFMDDPALEATPDPGMYPFELAFDILDEQPAIEEGKMDLPDDPGLGVMVDLDVIDEYPFVEGPWTEFHYED
jgi:L-alanine-DL-glutamate epimerase-like enolase superfamily enzyme